MSEEHDDKLTLTQLRRLRFPQRDRAGQAYTERRPHYFPHDGGYMWQITFDVDRWAWGIEMQTFDRADLDWTTSDSVVMWLHNYDPNRYLIGVQLVTVRDLLRFLDAFKVEYYFVPVEDVQPVDYRGFVP